MAMRNRVHQLVSEPIDSVAGVEEEGPQDPVDDGIGGLAPDLKWRRSHQILNERVVILEKQVKDLASQTSQIPLILTQLQLLTQRMEKFQSNQESSQVVSPSKSNASGERTYKRGRNFENGLVIGDEDDDGLVLFNEMQDRERDEFLVHTFDVVDDSLSKLGYLSDCKIGISTPARGDSSDLLNVDDGRSDYEWLLTPPETPPFHSLDDEEPQPQNLQPQGRLRIQPINISRSLFMDEKNPRNSRSSATPHRFSPSLRSGDDNGQFQLSPSPAPRSSSLSSQRSSIPPNFAKLYFLAMFFIFDPGGRNWYLRLRSLLCCSLELGLMTGCEVLFHIDCSLAWGLELDMVEAISGFAMNWVNFWVLIVLASSLEGLVRCERPAVVNIGAVLSYDSVIGRVAKVAIGTIVGDVNTDGSLLGGTKLNLIMEDSNCSPFIGSVRAFKALEKEAVVIIGPQSSTTVHMISSISNGLQIPLVSFAAIDPTLSARQYPFFIRMTRTDSYQMTAMAHLLGYYGWRRIIAIFVDNEYGRNGIYYQKDKIAEKMLMIYEITLPIGTSWECMLHVLQNSKNIGPRVYVVHTSPDSGLEILSAARQLDMMTDEYVNMFQNQTKKSARGICCSVVPHKDRK